MELINASDPPEERGDSNDGELVAAVRGEVYEALGEEGPGESGAEGEVEGNESEGNPRRGPGREHRWGLRTLLFLLLLLLRLARSCRQRAISDFGARLAISWRRI